MLRPMQGGRPHMSRDEVRHLLCAGTCPQICATAVACCTS